MNTVLILHGWGASSKSWVKVRELLEEKGINVVVPDLPGFGGNPAPSEPWSVDDYAAWVNGFCQRESLSNFFLLGHSFGGATAIKFALKHPEKISKLFLVGSGGIRRKRLKIEIIKGASKILKVFSFLPFYSLLRKFCYKMILSDYPQTQGVMRESYLKVIKEDFSDILSGIAVPTVIVWGAKDNIFPVRYARFMKEKIKNSQLEILVDIKHNPHSEAPETLVNKILKYL